MNNTPLSHADAVRVCVARIAQLDQAIACAGALTPVGVWLTDVRFPWRSASKWLAGKATTQGAVEALIVIAAQKANQNNVPARQPLFVGYSEVSMFLNQLLGLDQLTAYLDRAEAGGPDD